MRGAGAGSFAGLALAVTLVSSSAAAQEAPAATGEPVLMGIEAAAAVPLASPQIDYFTPGGTVAVSLQTPIAAWIVPTFRLRGTLLGDGPAPADSTLRDPGVGTAFGLTLGLRLRPIALAVDDGRRGTGLWIEVDAGGALTGATLVRPVFEAGLGWNFEVGDVGIGPSVRFQHVLHFDDPIDSRSAMLLLAGLEIVLFDHRVVVPEPPVRGDRDQDGIFDDEDECPDEPEDRDEFQDEDGCPDPDNDRDGILDPADECPLEPEDADGWQDEDGCPELDNDQDGFLHPQDQCPNEAEVLNGVDDDDGCPDEGLIQMVDDRIVLEERVLFDFERARVKHSARPILQAIVDLWRQHPEWTRVRIEGHADARGDAAFNQELSERRARRVCEVLIELGIPESLFEVAGFGARVPRDPGDSEEAHQRNRRVEFVVVSRRTDPDASAPSAESADAPAPDAPESSTSGEPEGSMDFADEAGPGGP